MTVLLGIALAALALISTLGAGLELELSRVRSWSQLGRPLLSALLANCVVIPGSILVLRLLKLPNGVFVGLALVALSPGGASSPLLARLAGGDATRIGAVYVALCCLSLITLGVSVPHLLPATGGAGRVILITFVLQLLPLGAGMLARRRFPLHASRLASRLRSAGSALLGAIVLLLLITRGAFLSTLDATTLASMVGIAALSLSSGAWTPRPRLPDALLSCVRNLTLALMIAELAEPGGSATLIVAAYGLVMYLVASLCLLIQKRVGRTAQEQA